MFTLYIQRLNKLVDNKNEELGELHREIKKQEQLLDDEKEENEKLQDVSIFLLKEGCSVYLSKNLKCLTNY